MERSPTIGGWQRAEHEPPEALDQFVEEARQLNAHLAEVDSPGFATPDALAASRARFDDPDGPFGARVAPELPVETRTIAGPGGPVPLRIFRPDRVDAVYLDIHGGAWVLGFAAMDDAENAKLAKACGVAVVSVDYRLAPEHPYPAGPDDCERAALWILDHADELGAEQLVIGGASAGAHLAAVTLLRLRDRHDVVDRCIGANLVYGVYDITLTPSVRLASDGLLRAAHMRDAAAHFTPGLSWEQRRDPAISPLFAELHDLPPALFTVGALDGLLDDSLFMAARWQMAGNPAELAVYPESPHGFTVFPSGMARAARRHMRSFIARCIDAAPASRTRARA